jgi:hypothetical protein
LIQLVPRPPAARRRTPGSAAARNGDYGIVCTFRNQPRRFGSPFGRFPRRREISRSPARARLFLHLGNENSGKLN